MDCWQGVQLMIARRPLVDRDVSSNPGERPAAGDLVAAVIPGTNEAEDWWDGNLHFWPHRIPGLPGWWRRGFMLAGDWVAARVARACRPVDRLVLAGHSYGAAAAICAAAYAIRASSKLDSVLAFAPPRTTTSAGARWISDVLGDVAGQRFTLGVDVVPYSVLPVMWRQALELVHNHPADGSTRSKGPVWDEVRFALHQRGLQAIRNHSMSSYARWMSRLPAPIRRVPPAVL